MIDVTAKSVEETAFLIKEKLDERIKSLATSLNFSEVAKLLYLIGLLLLVNIF